MQAIIHKFIQSCFSLCKIILNFRYQSSLQKIKKGKEHCFVFGNGPSLSKDILGHEDFYASQSVFCVNNFAQSDVYELIKPAYYAFYDPLYWNDNLPSEYVERIGNTFRSIKEKTTWEMTILIPHQAKKSKLWKTVFQDFPNIKISYFNNTLVDGFKIWDNWMFANNLGVPLAQNVLVIALYLALTIGFKKIFILGADHSWHKEIELNDSGVLYVKDHHFYDKQEAKSRPWYNGKPNGIFYVHEIFAALSKMFYGYMLIREYAMYLNAKVYNASSISYIDAFEKSNIEQLYNEPQQ